MGDLFKRIGRAGIRLLTGHLRDIVVHRPMKYHHSMKKIEITHHPLYILQLSLLYCRYIYIYTICAKFHEVLC